MILTRTHTSIPPVPSEPSVGAKAVTRHLRDNASRIRGFLTSLEPTVRETMPELELGDAPVSLSLVIEKNRISLVPGLDVRDIVTEDYMFTCRLVDGTTRADVCKAMASGALPYLASAQVQVRLMNKLGHSNTPPTAAEMSQIMAGIGADSTSIVRVIEEQRAAAKPAPHVRERIRRVFMSINGHSFVLN